MQKIRKIYPIHVIVCVRQNRVYMYAKIRKTKTKPRDKKIRFRTFRTWSGCLFEFKIPISNTELFAIFQTLYTCTKGRKSLDRYSGMHLTLFWSAFCTPYFGRGGQICPPPLWK